VNGFIFTRNHSKMFQEIFSLFYPRLCAGCSEPLMKNEVTLCANCMMDLPFTYYHCDRENPVVKLFWGRVDVHFATALCFFAKATRMQRMLHELKYRGNQEVGELLGVELGKQIRDSPHFGKIDRVIPVPLHPHKEKIRGYNQSRCIAEGISRIIDAPVDNQTLIRTGNSSTQTRKSRFSRWENVEAVFTVQEPQILYEKHILLVDDVVTTGATIEACCSKLISQPEVKVSVAALACA
jgi:ComF family protein